MKKVFVSIIMVVLLLISGFLAYLLITTPRVKEFEKKGITIQLESDFEVVESENWDFYVANDEIAFMANRHGKASTIKGPGDVDIKLTDFTLSSYLSFILALYGINTEEDKENNVTIYNVDTYGSGFYYCYYKDGTGKYAYMLFVKQNENFFYTMNLACAADKLDDYRTKMLQYAISVEVE